MTILAHTGKRSTIAPFAAVMLAVGLTSGLVYFAPSFANDLVQVSALDDETGDIARMSASRKVRCIMPPAWRRHCEQ